MIKQQLLLALALLLTACAGASDLTSLETVVAENKTIPREYRAQGRFDAAAAALVEAREQLSHTEIRAPHPGLVTERHVEVGEVASPGQPLMSGISLDNLRVIVDVPQSVKPALRKFGQVRVRLPNEESLDIRDLTVYPIADSGSSSFRVRVTLPEGTKELFPGMFVKVSLITGERAAIDPYAAVVVLKRRMLATIGG